MSCWITQALIDDAFRRGVYLNVDKPKTYYYLKIAPRLWTSHPEVIFLPQYRLVGELTSIISQLKCLGFQIRDIQTIIAHSFTAYNTRAGMGYHAAFIQAMREDDQIFEQLNKK